MTIINGFSIENKEIVYTTNSGFISIKFEEIKKTRNSFFIENIEVDYCDQLKKYDFAIVYHNGDNIIVELSDKTKMSLNITSDDFNNQLATA